MLGKHDTLDHTAQALIALVAVFSMAHGAFMLINPFGWYDFVPTVVLTGPPNQHFIRDIGLAYLMSGAMLAYAAPYPQGRWMAACAGNIWLTAHGLFHIWEVAAGICGTAVFLQDAPGVLGPPALVWLGIGILFVRQRITPAGLPKAVLLNAVHKMSPDESAYVREIADAPGHAFEKFANFIPVTNHRWETPNDLFHMARIGATMIEDCGPCAHTAAQNALSDGVNRDAINLALAGTPPQGDLKTAFDFGQAIALHAEDATTLGDAIETKFGRAVRLELAMTSATVRAYPAMKRGLGLGKPCAMVPMQI